MIKKSFSFSAIFFAIIMMFSCNKENAIKPTTNDDLVLGKILDFKENVNNPKNLKSGETLTIDETIWLVEAALNYSHCIVSEENALAGANEQIIDSLFFDLNISNNQISYQEAINAYLNFETEMQNYLNLVDAEIKFFYIANVELSENSLKTTFAIRHKSATLKSTNSFYTITDSWHWGYDLGNCSGTVIGKDATDEINKWIISRASYIPGAYYTDIHYVGMFASFTLPSLSYLTDLTSYGSNMFHYYSPQHLNYPMYYCIEQGPCNTYASESKQALTIVENNFIEPTEDVTTWIFTYVHYWRGQLGHWEGTDLYHYFYMEAGTRHIAPAGGLDS